MHASAEGWYTDPWDLHEARWFSAGRPTALVRDADSESHDQPPDRPYSHGPEPFEGHEATGPGELRRADDADDTWYYDHDRAQEAVWEQFGRSAGQP
jgi:hypothetical protein